jgi:HdeA/HdeB family
MKTLYAAVAALLVSMQSAIADPVDVSNLTCKQLATLPDDQKIVLAIWLEGYVARGKEPLTFDLANFGAHLDKAKLDCDANPDKLVLEVYAEAAAPIAAPRVPYF